MVAKYENYAWQLYNLVNKYSGVGQPVGGATAHPLTPSLRPWALYLVGYALI